MNKITDNSKDFDFFANPDYTFIRELGGNLFVNDGDKSIVYQRDGGSLYKFNSINNFCSEWIAQHPMLNESDIKETQNAYINAVLEDRDVDNSYGSVCELFGL